jgi:hypothetical protein
MKPNVALAVWLVIVAAVIGMALSLMLNAN